MKIQQTRFKTHNWVLGGVFGMLLVSGCGPLKRSALPEDWPAQWRGRQLYHTPEAYLYASSDAAAGEIDRLLVHARRDFKNRIKSKPSKGLIIVSDVKDPLITDDIRSYYELTQTSALRAQQTPELTEAQVESRFSKLEQAMSEYGVSLDTELHMRTITVDAKALADVLGFSSEVTDDVDWAVVMPTRTVIENCCRQIMQDKLDRREQLLGPVDTLALSPFIVVEESRMVNRAAVNRDIALYLQWLADSSGWSEDLKQREASDYVQFKVQEAMFPVLSALRDVLEDVVDTVVEPLAPRHGS